MTYLVVWQHSDGSWHVDEASRAVLPAQRAALVVVGAAGERVERDLIVDSGIEVVDGALLRLNEGVQIRGE